MELNIEKATLLANYLMLKSSDNEINPNILKSLENFLNLNKKEIDIYIDENNGQNKVIEFIKNLSQDTQDVILCNFKLLACLDGLVETSEYELVKILEEIKFKNIKNLLDDI